MTNTADKPKFEDMIPWTGGECPWDGEVYTLLRDEPSHAASIDRAEDLRWDHNLLNSGQSSGDIIAYMPVQLWEEGYRRPNNDCISSDIKLDLINIDMEPLSDWFSSQIEWSEILLWKPSQQPWNPTSATLDDMAKHCEENMEKIMTDNRPLDFIGSPLFEDESLESLFNLYKQYKQERESAENMMAKVVQEIEYRTPDEWNIELKNVQEDSSSEEIMIVGEVNDYKDWGYGDLILCLTNGIGGEFKENQIYQVVCDHSGIDEFVCQAKELDGDDIDWVDISKDEFVKIVIKAQEQ